MDQRDLIANMQGLTAVLLAAQKRGIDIQQLANEAKSLLIDSGQPCKWGPAESLEPSQQAVQNAVDLIKNRG